MWLLLLTSVAALFPGATLSLDLGWKAVSVFDIFFALVLLNAALSGGFTRVDRRLLLAGGLFCSMAWLTLARAYTPAGLRIASATTYSVLVLLVIAHLRIDKAHTRRFILWASGIATSIAWLTVVAEMTLGLRFAGNHSGALPTELPRLGGFTGGSVLGLFLAMAAPFARQSALAQAAVLFSSYATLARSMAGVGVATLLSQDPQARERSRGAIMVRALSLVAITASVFAYTFAIAKDPTNPTAFASRFEAGPYRVLNLAALRMIADAPSLGHGLHTFPDLFRAYTSPHEQRQVGGSRPPVWDPHSAVFGLAAEQGLLALTAFVWLMVVIYRRLADGEDPHHRRETVASLFGLLAAGLVVDWISLKGLWLWMGFLVASSRPALSSTTPEGEPGRPSETRSGSASS
ncbi:MAG: hypothetical protein KA385_08540 [Vicinamibacteria bacterium]|nr:hypothetical protein [Vicinamibacteria bacterium]